jgi:hypothetical protein
VTEEGLKSLWRVRSGLAEKQPAQDSQTVDLEASEFGNKGDELSPWPEAVDAPKGARS